MADDNLLTPGNIDLYDRPHVRNADGSISTVRSMSFGDDKGREILIPTVVGNKVVSDEDAIREYERTGKHLGIFKTPEAATQYASQLHNDYAAGKYDKRPSMADQYKVVDVDGEPVEFPAGMSDAEIKAAISAGKPANKPANTSASSVSGVVAKGADLPSDEPKSSGQGYIPPGVIGAAGAGIKAASPYVRAGVNVVAKQAAKHPESAAATLATMGARIAGLPWWEGAVGSRMLGLGQYLKPAAQALETATATTMPRVAGKFAAIPAGRVAANTIFGRAIPGIGTAMMAYDAGKVGYGVGKKIDEATGLSQKMGDALGPLYNMITGNKPAQAIDPNDPMIQELLARQQGNQ